MGARLRNGVDGRTGSAVADQQCIDIAIAIRLYFYSSETEGLLHPLRLWTTPEPHTPQASPGQIL